MVYTALIAVSAVQYNAILSDEMKNKCFYRHRSQYFSELKSRLSLAWRGEKSLEETWPSLVRGLRRRLETLRGAGSVPSLHFKHINNNGGHLPAATLDKVGTNIALFLLTEYFLFSQLRRRGVIVIKAVLDGRTVTEMESELQKHLLDTTGPHHGLEPDIFW